MNDGGTRFVAGSVRSSFAYMRGSRSVAAVRFWSASRFPAAYKTGKVSPMDCWSQHLALKLIKLYKNKRLLWHPPHLLYYNKEAKQAAWEAIGEEVGDTYY